MRRDLPRRVARLLAGVLLFAQMIVAAHACDGLPQPGGASASHGASAAVAAALAADAMAVAAGDGHAPGCERMGPASDPDEPHACAQHCRAGQQSERTATLAAPPAMLTSLYLVAPPADVALPLLPAAGAVELHGAPPPPHAILHCCLRD